MAFFLTVLRSWDDIHGYARHGWIYRGQRSSDWELRTSLERLCDRQGVPSGDREKVERALLREFRRRYHQYSSHIPRYKIEWLSIMQHHGTPTRLLDVTYSIYVAAYFALEATDGDCAVWAVNAPWALQQSANLLRSAGKLSELEINRLFEQFEQADDQLIDKTFLQPPSVRLTCTATSFKLNERLSIQKGAFLIPGDVTVPFFENLAALPGHDDANCVLKLVIPLKERDEALHQLFQMNVSRTSLFPGLDGFAASLGVFHPVVFNPVKWR